MVYLTSPSEKGCLKKELLKKPANTLSNEDPPPCMSRGPKLLQGAETDQCKKAMGGYQKGIKVISKMNAGAGDAKILVLLFQRTFCLTIPTVERRRY